MTLFCKKLLFVFLAGLLPFGAQALYLNPEKVMTLSISRSGLTRLSVKKDKIQDIFVHPAEASNNVQLHKSGHVFLTPEGLEGPLSVTLITEVGHTQDLLLKFVSKTASPIYLEERAPLPPPISLQAPSKSPGEILSEFIFKGRQGGFEENPGTGEQRQVQEVIYRCLRSWTNNMYRICLFEAPPEEKGFETPLSLVKRDEDIVLVPGRSRNLPSFYVLQFRHNK